MSPVPRWLTWLLRGVCLVLGLAVLVVPELPRDWFLAVNPASGELCVIARSHTARVPLHLLWGLEGFRQVPLAARGLVFVALCGLTLVPKTRRVPRRAGPGRSWPGRLGRWRWSAVICGVAAVGVFWLLRVPYARNLEFGDAPNLKNDVEVGMVFAAEVLPYHLFNAVRGSLELFVDKPPGELAIALVSCLCGGVFVGAMVALVQAAAEAQARFLLFCGAALAGYTVMFCGYVETTQVELASMALYFDGTETDTMVAVGGRGAQLGAAGARGGHSAAALRGGAVRGGGRPAGDDLASRRARSPFPAERRPGGRGDRAALRAGGSAAVLPAR